MTTADRRPAQDTRTIQLATGTAGSTVCDRAQLTPGRGVAALLPDGRQAALFLDRAGRAYAIDNRDPFTGAYVLSRGLLGSAGGPAVRRVAAAEAAVRPGDGRAAWTTTR